MAAASSSQGSKANKASRQSISLTGSPAPHPDNKPSGSGATTPKRRPQSKRHRRRGKKAGLHSAPVTDTDADFIDMSNETTDDSDIEFLDGPSAAGPSSRPDETAGGEVAATDTKRKGRGDTDLDAPSTPSTSTSYRPTTFTPFRPMTFGMVVDAEDDDEQDEQEDGEIVESSTPAAKTSKNSPPPGDKGDPVQSKPVVHDRYDSGNESVLLLPGHVTIASAHAEGEEGEEEDDSPMEDVEGVYTVDDDRARGVQRYYMEKDADVAAFLAEADQSKICRKCKRPGHRERDCPHIICTTCGVEDDHERKDCPYNLLCYGCGQRGHKKQDCPDPASRRLRITGCVRCGVQDHTENSCPLIWRVYVYRSAKDREGVLAKKAASKGWEREALGGKGDEWWCYNCAALGHLGDDCKLRRGSLGRAVAHSAFSDHTASMGPFGNNGWRGGKSMGNPSGLHQRFDDDERLPHAERFQGADAGRKTREKEKERQRDRERQAERDRDRQRQRDRDSEYDQYRSSRDRDPYRRGRDADRPILHDSYRPWDSERRPRSPEGRYRPWDSERRRGRSRSPERRDSGPKGNVFGKMSMPPTLAARISSPGPADSPSIGRSRGGGNGRDSLLQRALAADPGRGSASPAPSNASSNASGSGKMSKKARKAAAKEHAAERDWEATWRRSGAGGGNVSSWGDDMDREERAAAKDDRVKAGPVKKATKGQRYTGGY